MTVKYRLVFWRRVDNRAGKGWAIMAETGVQTTIRLTAESLERAAALVPFADRDPLVGYRGVGRLSVVRMAFQRGLVALEKKWLPRPPQGFTVSTAEIEALRAEAGEAGDLAQVAICDLALKGAARYRAACAAVIAEARAANGGETP